MAKLSVYNLGLEGVNRNKSPIHLSDGELQHAQNAQIRVLHGRGAITKRDALATYTTEDMGAAVASFVGVTFVPGDDDDGEEGEDLRARVVRSGNLSLTNATLTLSGFDVEDYDVGGLHDNAVNNSRITVPANGDGFWLIVAQASFGARAAVGGRVGVYIYRNTTTRVAIAEDNSDPGVGDGGLGTSIQCAAIIPLTAGDYVELFARQDSGGALNLLGGASDLTSLTAFRLRAT